MKNRAHPRNYHFLVHSEAHTGIISGKYLGHQQVEAPSWIPLNPEVVLESKASLGLKDKSCLSYTSNSELSTCHKRKAR